MRTVRNSELASDAVQNTFTKAWESLQKGKPPTHAKAWLYAIARNSAVVRRRETAGESEGDGEEDETSGFSVMDTDRYSNPEEAAQDKELVELVWSSAAALSTKDYTLLDLHVRRGLNADELAESLGLRKGNVYTMLSRLRDSLEDSVTANLLARRGRQECSALDALIDFPAASGMSRQLSRKVEKHVRDCPICQESRHRFTSPVEIFAGLAPIGAVLGLEPRIWANVKSKISGSGSAETTGLASRLGQIPLKVGVAAAFVAMLGLIILGVTVFSGSSPGVSDPDDVRSTSHEVGQESVDDTIVIAWSAQSDVSGYSTLWSSAAVDLPEAMANLPGDATGTESDPLPAGSWYFHMRTQGHDGTWTSTVHLGPFLVILGATPTPTPTLTPAPTPRPTSVLAPNPTATSTPSAAIVPTPTSAASTATPMLEASVGCNIGVDTSLKGYIILPGGERMNVQMDFRDDHGAPVAGISATVELNKAGDLSHAGATTDDQGQINFLVLDGGSPGPHSLQLIDLRDQSDASCNLLPGSTIFVMWEVEPEAPVDEEPEAPVDEEEEEV